MHADTNSLSRDLVALRAAYDALLARVAQLEAAAEAKGSKR